MLGYRYTTALHWSLTQFTPGSMHVQPMNVLERTYSICTLVFGLILFSSFISNITASMTQLRSMSGETTRQFWLLRRFLRQHSVSSELAFRILRYTEFQCLERQNEVPESRVTILSHLSEQLRNELHFVTSFTVVRAHPLFQIIAGTSEALLHRLCKEAMSKNALAKHDQIFSEDTKSSVMYMVVDGEVCCARSRQNEFAEKNDWLCEQALWTTWSHICQARAATECQIVCVDSKAFNTTLIKDMAILVMTQSYAIQFVAWLNEATEADLTEIFRASQVHSFVAKATDEGTPCKESAWKPWLR
jgi:hypothetical protein